MKLFLKISTLLLVVCTFMFVACQKEEATKPNITAVTKTPLRVIDGMLSFSDQVSFEATLKQLDNMSENDFITWEKSNNFVSRFSVEEGLQAQLSEAKSKSEYERLVSENTDIIQMVDDLPTTQNRFKSLAKILNREGNLYINNALYNFSEKGEIIVKSGEKSLLKRAMNTMTNDPSKGIFCFPVAQQNDRAACGVYQVAESSNSATAPDRKVKVEAFFVRITTLGGVTNNNIQLHNISVSSKILGTPYKKNIWGNWVTYKTHNHINSTYKVETFDPNFSFKLKNRYFSHLYSNYYDGISDGAEHIYESNVPQGNLGGYDLYFAYVNKIFYNSAGVYTPAEINCQ